MATLPSPPNIVSLVSLSDSILLHVRLYTGRAEIYRQFTFNVSKGQNQLNITGLPNVIEKDSLRVQGKGDATIHEVSVSSMPQKERTITSPALKDLDSRKNLVKQAITRATISSETMEKYMHSMTVHDVPLDQVGAFLDNYESHGSRLDEQLESMRKEEKALRKQIEVERARLTAELDSPSNNGSLEMQVSLGLFAESEGEIELEIVYAVTSANWEPVYDIRVDLESKEHSLTLVYKAAIVQDTGEDWTNAPLTLETATPSYGVAVPDLRILRVGLRKPDRPLIRQPSIQMPEPMVIALPGTIPSGFVFASTPAVIPPPPPIIIPSAVVDYERTSRRGRSRSPRYRRRSRSPSLVASVPPPRKALGNVGLIAASKGNNHFNHSVFQVPGLITVPCDGTAHNVMIVELDSEVLETKLSWFAVPKVDTRVHLNAKIKNNSEYTLIPGKANVYVDGSFIARSEIPAVGPGESFDCSLGLDSSIKLTYHPLSSKATHRTTVFTTATTTTLYSQRVTVTNTKRINIDVLKLLDRVPVSEDEKIQIKVIKPAELNKVGSGGQGSAEAVSVAASLSLSSPINEKTGISFSELKNVNDDSSSSTSISKSSTIKRFSSLYRKQPGKSQDETRSSIIEESDAESTLAKVAQTSSETTKSWRVFAQWDGADAENSASQVVDTGNSLEQGNPELKQVGIDGKMNWLLYDIPPRGTVNLLLEWEVSKAANVDVVEREV